MTTKTELQWPSHRSLKGFNTRWVLIPAEKTTADIHATAASIIISFFLLYPNLSHSDESKGSKSAKEEVIPTNNIDIKKTHK